MCTATVSNVSVEVKSPTSVTVSWLPPDPQFWNGVITSYIIVYELMRRVDEENSDITPIKTEEFMHPQPGEMFANDPDPRVSAYLPLQFESAVIDKIEEFYVYRFSVLVQNSVGESDVSNQYYISMPPAGTAYKIVF